MSPDCYLDDTFLITCNKTFQPPQPFLWESNLQVLSILPEVGELRILHRVSRFCFDSSGNINWNRSESWKTTIKNFSISYTRNKFTSVGCATTAFIYGPEYTTGCIADCNHTGYVVNGLCTGIGCCEARIPRGVRQFNFLPRSLGDHSSVNGFNPCSFLFVAEEGNYSFNSVDLWNLRGHDQFPVVLDWAVGTVACPDAERNTSSYACRSLDSVCVNSTNGPGYRCNCSSGFRGNPYLYHGCQDIDECEENPNICGDGSVCSNSPPGNYSCSCKKGYQKDGGICRKKSQKSIWQNISLEDLKRAANNYDDSRIIGQGGYGTVYKGVLLDNREVAIKKSKISEQSQIEQFINEVVILSEINHVNVVKLIGCCLETEVPSLVYEFIPNGTLSDHIHNESRASSLSWEMRLKIAAESAWAIAYIHHAISTPIIHRDIKSTNILLDKSLSPSAAEGQVLSLTPSTSSGSSVAGFEFSFLPVWAPFLSLSPSLPFSFVIVLDF
ncbi:hypothetical protein LguiA_004384 [Lonicera macranthoides]